jgi:hypothetical protein
LGVEHTVSDNGTPARRRVIFLVCPSDDTSPKAAPDDESLMAWL